MPRTPRALAAACKATSIQSAVQRDKPPASLVSNLTLSGDQGATREGRWKVMMSNSTWMCETSRSVGTRPRRPFGRHTTTQACTA